MKIIYRSDPDVMNSEPIEPNVVQISIIYKENKRQKRRRLFYRSMYSWTWVPLAYSPRAASVMGRSVNS